MAAGLAGCATAGEGAGAAAGWQAYPPRAAASAGKIVIAHRGASGYLPEHTLEAYTMAHTQGADYVEPDLVLTKDGRFICLHDIHLEKTTDVEAVFPERGREDGRWYAADFTLAEIKTLRVHSRVRSRFPVGTSEFRVPTFEEMIELVQGLNGTTGRTVGIYPELKAPSWHRKQGLPMEEAFLAVLDRYGYRGPDAAVFVQCFEAEPLRRMRNELGSNVPQILLLGGDPEIRLLEPAGLKEVASYANGIGPDKILIEKKPEVVEAAHKAGLLVHPYTFVAEFVPPQYAGFEQELAGFYFEYGVDGLFTDFPDRAVQVLVSPPETDAE
ncbi:MAG: glycerophosphodiester phosphodiesterase [Candidatus Hydrogenedentes bacterium]|nr:glycerophosphodiester phosphodiesterase [Candidatus Hydrogenedentota bacterium]